MSDDGVREALSFSACAWSCGGGKRKSFPFNSVTVDRRVRGSSPKSHAEGSWNVRALKEALVKVGQIVQCAVRGPVVVKGFTRGRTRWPYHHPRGEHQLIVTNDLQRAVRQESTFAVAYHWGACRKLSADGTDG